MHQNKFVINIYYISLIVTGHSVDLFALKVGVLVLKVTPYLQHMFPVVLFITRGNLKPWLFPNIFQELRKHVIP